MGSGDGQLCESPVAQEGQQLALLTHAPKNHLGFVLPRSGFAHNRAPILRMLGNSWHNENDGG